MALLLRRRIEQDVGDAVRRQVQIEVLRVAVRRADLAVVELVAALRVCLDQADDVVLSEEPEPTIPDLHRREKVPEVHPSMGVHLEAVSFREMPQDAGHRPAEDFDLLVVQEEFTLVPAMGAELLAEVTVRTTFLQHRPLLGWLVFANGL